MQALTRTLKEAIRGSYQVPLAKIEIINADGSSAGEILDVIDVSMGNFSSRNIKRSIKLSLDNSGGQYTPHPDLYDRNLLWYNKKMKLFYGYKTKRMGIRYIRDWLNGSNSNEYNHWVEIQAIDQKEINVAQGKTVTGSFAESNMQEVTDGSTSTSEYTGWGPGLAQITVDLGSVQNLKEIKVWHYYGDGRTYYGTKTEVSEDGVHWFTIFDSAISGTYQETAAGKTHAIDSAQFGGSEEWLPQGVFNINGIDPSVGTDGITLELEGQDILEALVEDQFDDIYSIEVTATESVNYALPVNGGSATASTSIVAGDEIQNQAKIHYIDTTATINGLVEKVENKNIEIDRSLKEDFSAHTTGIFPASNWTKESGAPVISDTSADGSKSLYFPGDGVYHRVRSVQKMVLAGGDVFRCTIKAKGGAGTGSTLLYIALIFEDGTYTYFTGMTGVNVTSASWQDISGTLTVPAGKKFGSVWVFNYTGNTKELFLDNIEVIGGDLADQGINLIDKNKDLGWGMLYVPRVGTTVTEIESEVFLDLQDALQLQQVVVNLTDGATLTDFLYTSPDNATWTSFTSATVTPSGPVRFIKFKVRKQSANVDGSWSMGISEIQIKTASNFLPAAAIDGDVYDTNWRPSPTDPDPWIQIDLGQARTFNAIYTYWGKNSFDFWNRVKYFIETSANGSSWSRVSDLNSYDENNSFYGEVEHCILSRNARYIRINIKARDGVAIFRNIKVANINASKSIRDNMIDVLETTSITQYEIPYTRRYIERKMAEIGDEKEAFLQSLAVSANWQQGTDENGVYKAAYRDINPVDYAWDFTTDDDNIFEFNVFLSNDIKNVIVVTCEASDKKAIVGRASDTNPLSPTSIQNLGRRVQLYKGESYNTQAICDRKAQEQLFERTRSKHHTSIPTTGHPAIQVDDVVRVTVDEAKIIQAFFLVTGYESSYKADTAEFDTRINISLLV